jgi:hypothetical protein
VFWDVDLYVSGQQASFWKSNKQDVQEVGQFKMLSLCVFWQNKTQLAARHPLEHKGGDFLSALGTKAWTTGRNAGAGMMIMRNKTIQYSRDNNSACKNPSVFLAALCLEVKYVIQGAYSLMKSPCDVEKFRNGKQE